MAVSDIEAVLEFLRKNGLSESESALMEDILEKSQLGSYDFERFVFPMVPPPPPLRITSRQLTLVTSGRRGDEGADSFSDYSDEFVSLGSSSADLYPSDFTNPYGIHTATGSSSHASSDRLSQFGTARDYHDFDMQNDLLWYRENDHDYVMPPCFDGPDSFGGPSEDKFVMTIETENQNDDLMGISHITEQFRLAEKTNSVNKPWPSNFTSMDHVKDDVEVRDYYNTDQNIEADVEDDKEDCAMYSCSAPLCGFCAEGRELYAGDPADCSLSNVKNNDINGFCYRASDKDSIKCNPVFEHKNIMCSINSISAHDWVENLEIVSGQTEVVKKESNLAGTNDCEPGHKKQVNGDLHLQDAATEEEGGDSSNELLIYDTNEDEYEVFNLRIFHRKNRTGFEEHKDLPIVLSSIIAGRYYVTEYLGSAAFSKVIQAYDLQTRMDVCLKIIKNDKDFFDQSLDEIKLLKFVNKHDPGDDCHILRLYDYFYYQEHLIIVCELLRANLYEFQKYNRESGGEPYFTLSRLQVITRQCLEALEYLHALGIIHCDLKPENILMKSYRRCEIKVIDLGSSCFQADNLCLYVQSRSYRAPEVIIGLPYDHKIDLWSLGCILAELCSGDVLFPNEAIVTILARMIGMLGPIDMEMLTGGQETHKYFTNEYDLYHINEETNQLEYIIPDESSLENHLQVSDIGFIEFVKSLLNINPNRRLSATEALQHPWLCYSY